MEKFRAHETCDSHRDTLRGLLNYLRSTMTEKRLNNCLLLHVHMDLTDSLNLQDIAIRVNDERHSILALFLDQEFSFLFVCLCVLALFN